MTKNTKIAAGLAIFFLGGAIFYVLLNMFGGPSEYVDSEYIDFQIESSQSQVHRLALGEVKIISGNPESGLDTRVWLRGVVGDEPSINPKTQETGPVFQTTSYNFTFTPGEVKITTGDEVNARNFV